MDDEQQHGRPSAVPTSRPRPRRRRAVAAWSALVVALGLVSAVYGVTSASAEASLGPHVAQYSVTTDAEVAVDLGPLGALVIDSPLPLHLGVDVVVDEIPRDVTDIGAPTSTVDLLGGDLDRYVQLFTAPQATLDVVQRALVLDAVRGWLLVWGLLVLVAVVARVALGPRRREELAVLGRRHRAVLAAVLAVSLVGAAVVAGLRPQAQRDAASQEASPVFDGTPLEGARITGRLASVVDLVGGYVTEQVRANDEFYARVTAGLERAWAQRSTDDPGLLGASAPSPTAGAPADPGATPTGTSPGAPAEAPLPAPAPTTATATAGATAPGAPAPGATAAPSATPSPTPAPSPLRGEDLVTALVVSDVHCNVGMAGPVGRLAELAEVDVVLNAGDTTMNGTAVEQTCVQALAGALADVPVVVADGNHDSAETTDQEEAVGWTVLDGEVVEVAGLRLLGVPDPRSTRLLQGTSSTAGGSAEETAERLVAEACAEEVDLLLVHDPSIGATALEEGCAPALVSGHYHVRTDPTQVGEGVRYISSSTAGAALDQLTVGPLNGTAEMTLLRFDAATGDVVSWRLVSATPDAEVAVGPWRTWPQVSSTATPVEDAPATLLPAGEPDDGPEAPPDAPGQPALDEDGEAVDAQAVDGGGGPAGPTGPSTTTAAPSGSDATADS
ncbi:metallophosphoesterase family protein [uncultured Pseudokineococcus sp.]|uniref:metallophosphoesterase family protein n=1 Tax=uncultured Pseudokineococcus sp. TaxID=1642928 RepID=UPI00261184DB|nr:metallophosphoesterase family protein [uncultured Pseudokineococcus sp.]